MQCDIERIRAFSIDQHDMCNNADVFFTLYFAKNEENTNFFSNLSFNPKTMICCKKNIR